MSVRPTIPSGYDKRSNDFNRAPGPGAGSSSGAGLPLNIEDEGSPVPPSPTNTLNFVGSPVRAYYTGGKVIVSVASRHNTDGSPAAPGEGSGAFTHSELDGLEWEDSGHTADPSTIAGFDAAGVAKEYPQAKLSPSPHSVAMTDGTGRLAYAIVPSPALEYSIIGLSIMLG